MSQELQPTIENPFAKVKRVYKPPFSLDRKTAATQNKSNPIPDAEAPIKEEPEYKPSYFVSQATRRYINNLVMEQKLTSEELPLIYEFAQLTATVFKRQPTISDFEISVRFRTVEGLREVAEGKDIVKIERKDNTGAPINPREAAKIWQQAANKVVELYEAAHPEEKLAVEPMTDEPV